MWNLLLPALATLGGAFISSSANTKAAETASAAALQGAQIQADAIREGSDKAQATLNEIRAESAPATGYLRNVIANPTELTPLQLQALTDNRRDVNNTIHNSSFAGSGRTAAALFKRADADFVNGAIAANVGRADTAAGTMYGASTGAATGSANLAANTGAAIGKAVGDATSKAGLYDAQAGLATGQVTGKAIGDIGSLIANQQRDSRYADTLSNINSKLRTM